MRETHRAKPQCLIDIPPIPGMAVRIESPSTIDGSLFLQNRFSLSIFLPFCARWGAIPRVAIRMVGRRAGGALPLGTWSQRLLQRGFSALVRSRWNVRRVRSSHWAGGNLTPRHQISGPPHVSSTRCGGVEGHVLRLSRCIAMDSQRPSWAGRRSDQLPACGHKFLGLQRGKRDPTPYDLVI